MVGNSCQHLAQIALRIEPVELGRPHEAVDRRRAFAARVRAHDEVVLAPQADAPQCALGGIVVDLDAAIVEVARQRSPPRQRAPIAPAISDFADTRPTMLLIHACSSSSRGPARAWRCRRRSSGGWPRMSASTV